MTAEQEEEERRALAQAAFNEWLLRKKRLPKGLVLRFLLLLLNFCIDTFFCSSVTVVMLMLVVAVRCLNWYENNATFSYRILLVCTIFCL